MIAAEAGRRFLANLLNIPEVYYRGEEIWPIIEEFGNLISRFDVY